MNEQTITWTVLPNGITPGLDVVRFSLHVAPRLLPDPAPGELIDFPDWANWPARVSGAAFQLEFPDLVDPGTGRPVRAAAKRVSAPGSGRWTALFTDLSRVNGHSLTRFTRRRIRSYPARHVRDFLDQRYGRFGARTPERFPTLDELTADDAFGPVGFELDSDRAGLGPERKKRLRDQLERMFSLGAQDPAGWAVPFRPGDAATADGVALTFLQAERFHRRRPPIVGDLPPLPAPEPDFHQVVAMTREHHHLQRLLGLVLDLGSTDPVLLGLARGNEQVTRVRVVTDLKPLLGSADAVHVRPTMRCRIGKGARGHVFTATPQDTDSDLRDGLLRVGDPDRFAVVQVDPDSAAPAVREFADTVTRLRVERGGQVRKRSASTPDEQALPVLRTAGFSVGRLSRAARLAAKVDRGRAVDEAAFGPGGDEITDDIALNADDVVRGYRWDVRDENGGEVELDPDFPFDAKFGPRALPRLRFGRRYRFRARAVDIAGNSLTAEQADAVTDAAPSTPVETFRRFEPVDATRYAEPATRDAAVLEQHSSARALPAPADRHWCYDTDQPAVPYLPEPLAKRILVRGLPGGATSTAITAVDPATWPTARVSGSGSGRARPAGRGTSRRAC
ncbi:hypothetical protein [Saccharothrix xinjiangensis]|uniref:Uncharacterized protein n=1 Tax=Saccharothrix xinjiangensis TaxID=204798 RepID=A0ABV9YFV9_9PSEU